MKVLIMTLFVFATSFFSTSVLAENGDECETKNIGAFYYNKCKEISESLVKKISKDSKNITINILKNTLSKLEKDTSINGADSTIKILKEEISKLEKEKLEIDKQSIPSEIPSKKIPEYACKINNDDCNKDQIAEVENACKKYPQICEFRDAIDLYKPNYFLYGLADNTDNEALEVQYSLRYNLKTRTCVKTDKENVLFVDYACAKEKEKAIDAKSFLSQSEIFLSLTGVYDFYFNENSKNRSSEPVINRWFNPAIHYRYHPTNELWFDLSLNHLSNGQKIDYSPNTETEFKNRFKRSADNEHYEKSDDVSISMDFIALELQKEVCSNCFFGNDKIKVSFRTVLDYDYKGNIIFDESGNRIEGKDFEDYHKHSLSFILDGTKKSEKSKRWLAEFSLTGHKKTSFDALVSVPNQLPLLKELWPDNILIRYHKGYLSRLSNYNLKEETFGVGFGVAF